MAYIELQLTTNYSFLRGASHVEELIATAQLMGYEAIAVTDRNTVAGMARASQRAEEAGLRLVPGCRLVLEDAPSLLAYPTDRAAWSNLCRLLTLGKRRAHKHGLPAGSCLLHWADVAAHARGLIAAMLGMNRTTPCPATSPACVIRFPTAPISPSACAGARAMPCGCITSPCSPSPRGCRYWRPAMCCITSPSGASCRTW